jgi:hypothetical protein
MAHERAGEATEDLLLAAFLDGAARVLDIGAMLDMSDPSPLASDADATRSDWAAVAADLSGAAKLAR